ncbi:MAG: VPLPA-CTERM sorting domain-containing protein, partial [Alphaproteobacteria bacterium]|nr:VPLPA-CTERM sorting domain-containing protein [Alphaproteobacteria bacterium]
YGDDGANDFAVAALSYEPVPLPAALPLFLAGLAGLGFARGRKRQAA